MDEIRADQLAVHAVIGMVRRKFDGLRLIPREIKIREVRAEGVARVSLGGVIGEQGWRGKEGERKEEKWAGRIHGNLLLEKRDITAHDSRRHHTFTGDGGV
jgi:hypothetical protein